jgi:YD repeat-containing protein
MMHRLICAIALGAPGLIRRPRLHHKSKHNQVGLPGQPGHGDRSRQSQQNVHDGFVRQPDCRCRRTTPKRPRHDLVHLRCDESSDRRVDAARNRHADAHIQLQRRQRVTAFLQSATNPETGTVSYTYNSNNTLASKTDAKGQNFTYAYDTYNRLTTIKVNGTLLRTFIYDTNTLDNTGFSQNTLGRLAAVQYPANSANIQFNDMYSYVAPGRRGRACPRKSGCK